MSRAIAQPWPAEAQRPQTFRVWLLVFTLLLAYFPLPAAFAGAPQRLTLVPSAQTSSCLEDCCGSELEEDACCSPEESEEDPCCPEGCQDCHRSCCATLVWIVPPSSAFEAPPSGARMERRAEVLRSTLAWGVFHPPRR